MRCVILLQGQRAPETERPSFILTAANSAPESAVSRCRGAERRPVSVRSILKHFSRRTLIFMPWLRIPGTDFDFPAGSAVGVRHLYLTHDSDGNESCRRDLCESAYNGTDMEESRHCGLRPPDAAGTMFRKAAGDVFQKDSLKEYGEMIVYPADKGAALHGVCRGSL